MDYPWTAKFFVALAIVGGLAALFAGWTLREHENAVIAGLRNTVAQNKAELKICRDMQDAIARDTR